MVESRSKNYLTMALEEIAQGAHRGREPKTEAGRRPAPDVDVLVGVTGGIAAYRACELVRLLRAARASRCRRPRRPRRDRFVGETTLVAASRAARC